MLSKFYDCLYGDESLWEFELFGTFFEFVSSPSSFLIIAYSSSIWLSLRLVASYGPEDVRSTKQIAANLDCELGIPLGYLFGES